MQFSRIHLRLLREELSIFRNPTNRVEVLFDDGEVVEISYNQLNHNWYPWMFFREYPDTPFYSRHLLNKYVKDGMISSSSVNDCSEVIRRDIIEFYRLYDPKLIEPLNKIAYTVCNNHWMDIGEEAQRYIQGMNIIDILSVSRHPKMVAIKKELKPNADSIAETYKNARDLLLGPEFAGTNNPFVMEYRAGTIKRDQADQMVVTRGFVTEVDGSIIPTPVMSNFVEGMNTLFELVAESRNAAKSHYNSAAPLEQSEYSSRRVQIGTAIVEKIIYGDCGTLDYITILVSPRIAATSESTARPPILPFIDGCYYYDDENILHCIDSKKDTHLEGRYIRMRSPLKCNLKNPHHVCSVCFGLLSLQFSERMNLGYMSSAQLGEKLSQDIISTKHVTMSSSGGKINLHISAKHYFNVDEGSPSLSLKKTKYDNLVVVFLSNELSGIQDAMEVAHTKEIPLTRISEVSKITVCGGDGKRPINDRIDVRVNGKKVHLSLDFVMYIKQNGFFVDSNNNYVVRLNEWDFNKSMLFIPQQEYSSVDLSKDVFRIVESTMELKAQREKPESVVGTLIELHDIVNSKHKIHLSLLQILIYAYTVSSPGKKDMSRGSPEPVMGVANDLTCWRSFGAEAAFEGVLPVLDSPRSYFKDDGVPDSPFDVCIDPKGVVDAYDKLNYG